MKKLFVGGLPYQVTSDQLRDLFAAIGEVASAQVATDKFTGRSRGFGFVEMPNDEDAEKAINQLNNSQLEGRSITVNEARPMERREPRQYNNDRPQGGGYGGGRRF
jgi:RNA recognition motif-containing protein